MALPGRILLNGTASDLIFNFLSFRGLIEEVRHPDFASGYLCHTRYFYPRIQRSERIVTTDSWYLWLLLHENSVILAEIFT